MAPTIETCTEPLLLITISLVGLFSPIPILPAESMRTLSLAIPIQFREGKSKSKHFAEEEQLVNDIRLLTYIILHFAKIAQQQRSCHV